MGNVMSDEEAEKEFLEEGFNLEAPDADQKINFGTSAPNCQPKHTQAALRNANADDERDVEESDEEGRKHDRESTSAHGTTAGGATDGSVSDLQPQTKRPHTTEIQPQQSQSQSQLQQQLQQQQQPPPPQQAAQPASHQPNPKKLSYIQMAKLGYQELVNAIIRPPRADYKIEQLGPPAFNFCGKRFTRTDFTLRTKRGYNLECSHWEPVERATDRIPVVIYMHGNSSARVEVIPQLSYLLSLGVAVFSFDFAGSGKSDGEYVSLGYYEREDLSCIVAHLRATNVVSTIALWGRSMGAATALMFGDRDPSIACMILDSPFADLTQLCEELVDKGREQGIVVPNFVVGMAIRMLQASVKKQAGFNIKQISPISHADKCFIPALFVAGEHDDFIKKHHSELLHEKYAGDKNIIIVEGDHNSPRPKFMFDSASIFLQTCLQIPNEWALKVPVSMNLMCPPWYFEMYQNRSQRRQQRQPALASSSSSSRKMFDHEEMGMTSERQRVIQASLFKMLGQADEDEGPAASATKPAAAAENSKNSSSSTSSND